jgi:hypothetical protein
MRVVGNLVQLRGIVKSGLANIESFKFDVSVAPPQAIGIGESFGLIYEAPKNHEQFCPGFYVSRDM